MLNWLNCKKNPVLIGTALLVTTATSLGQVTSFTSQSDFEAAMQSGGNTLLGVEDFEDFGLGNFEFLGGLDPVSVVATGLITPGYVPSGNLDSLFTFEIPRGEYMAINGPIGTVLPNTTVVVSGLDKTSDLLFGELSVVDDIATMNFEGRTGVGFALVETSTFNTLTVRVFGTDGETLLAEFFGVEGSPLGSFFGVASDVPIGRINIVDSMEGEAVTDVQWWGAGGGCAPDLDGNGMVDVFDLLSYLSLWFAADADAELTGDDPASIDVFDLLAYLDGWFAGC